MTRREARELIMKMLYERDFQPDKEIETILDKNLQDVGGKVREFVRDEFTGIVEHEAELDQMIAGSATNWSVTRIAKVDHMLLRMGAYELKWNTEVPTKVVVNEMIEIAKVYSTDKSPKFINGVLGNIVKSLEG